MQKLSKFILPLAIVIAGGLIAGAFVYINITNQTKGKSSAVITSQQAGEKAINFINQNLLQGKAIASLIETLEEDGLYKMKFTVGEQEIESYITLDGKLFFPEGINLNEVVAPAQEKSSTIGNFSISSGEICYENGKPIVYFFGSKSCPHCAWEHPIVERVAGKFGDKIAFHNNMDSENDGGVFEKYSTGGIPTVVLGCKYYRVGSGEQGGEDEEEKNLTALVCKLTDGQPADICDGVKDLINQISE